MCGWGGEYGVDISPNQSKGVSFFVNKSRRWKVMVLVTTIALVLVLPTGIMFPINQVRADRAIDKAKTQMDQRLYASAAKTLHSTPQRLIPPQKAREVRKLLIDNVRWGKDTAHVKSAKASLLNDDPEAALAELGNLDDDFPLDEEATDLIDLAQELDLEGDLDLSDDLLNDIAFIPDDPELDSLDSFGADVSDDLNSLESENSSGTGGSPSSQLELPEPPLTPADQDEFSRIPPQSHTLTPQEVPDGTDPGARPALRAFYYLHNSPASDNLYTIDQKGEVQPGIDRKTGKNGYKSQNKQGRLYNRQISGYEKRIIPLYRYYSSKNTDHFYSTNPNFSSGSTKANYQRQLVAGYIGRWSDQQKKCFAGRIPLYNIFNPETNTNFYSTNRAEVSNMINKAKYKNLRIIGCVWPS